MVSEYPEQMQLAAAHYQRAWCFQSLKQSDSAVDAFRAAIAAEKEHPNFQTTAALDFGWFAITEMRVDLFDEVDRLLPSRAKSADFPIEKFRRSAARAVIAAHRRIVDRAAKHAADALAAVDATHSGFAYHSRLGLVPNTPENEAVIRRLQEIRHG